MRIQLLPTTFDQNGYATQQQHLCCLVINDIVAVDAGSLAMSTTPRQKELIRDIVLSHAHLDHIAGLPIFIDDLFATLKSPIRIHASSQVIDALESYIFNWTIYPRFSELQNENGEVVMYKPFTLSQPFEVVGLNFTALEVNHKVPTVGFIIWDETRKIAISSDTAEMDGFWEGVNRVDDLDLLLIECAFPNGLKDLAHSSHHLTPELLRIELDKMKNKNCPIFVTNIKPMYREKVIEEIEQLEIPNLGILEVGRVYEV